MFHGRQAEPGSLLFGGVVGFKNPFLFFGRDSSSVVTNGHLNRIIGAAARLNRNFPRFAIKGVAGILQEVRERLGFGKGREVDRTQFFEFVVDSSLAGTPQGGFPQQYRPS